MQIKKDVSEQILVSPWAPITKEELLAFIGHNIAMGVVSLPSIHDYWSTDIIRSHPWFRSVMSRDRFCQILRYVHVADNSKALSCDDLNYDKLWKVRPMMNYLISRCSVYMDNLYSGTELFKDLLAMDTLCSGTLRVNRKNFPQCLKPSTMSLGPRGSVAFAYHNNITIVRWKDTRDVFAMSTAYSDTMTVVKRRVDNVVQEVMCPEIIKDYNAFMGGVDLTDLLLFDGKKNNEMVATSILASS